MYSMALAAMLKTGLIIRAAPVKMKMPGNCPATFPCAAGMKAISVISGTLKNQIIIYHHCKFLIGHFFRGLGFRPIAILIMFVF